MKEHFYFHKIEKQKNLICHLIFRQDHALEKKLDSPNFVLIYKKKLEYKFYQTLYSQRLHQLQLNLPH